VNILKQCSQSPVPEGCRLVKKTIIPSEAGGQVSADVKTDLLEACCFTFMYKGITKEQKKTRKVLLGEEEILTYHGTSA
jgi:hypothetical protein